MLTFFQRLRITTAVRLEWYDVFASLTRDGRAVADVLREMQTEFNSVRHPMAPVVNELLKRLSGGGTVKNIKNRSIGSLLTGLVPTNEALLIEAGETTGSIAKGFERAKEYVTSTDQLIKEVKGAMAQPIVLLLVLLAVIIFYSVKVLPEFSQMAPRAMWSARAQMYGRLADAAIPLALGILVGGGAIFFAYLKVIKLWTGATREALDKHIWPFTTAAQINSAAMLASLASFVGAGKPFADAVNTLGSNSDPYMADVYLRIMGSLKRGKSPPEALSECHIIPGKFHWIIRLYGKSTDFASSLNGLSQRFIETAIKRTKAAFDLIGLLVKLLIVGFVAWTMQTQFDIMQAVKGGVRVGEAVFLNQGLIQFLA